MSTQPSFTGLRASSGYKVLMFGLVRIEVAVAPAADTPRGTTRPAGKKLCSTHLQPVKQAWECPEGHPVAEPVKGYPWNGEFTVVTDEEMALAGAESDPTITLKACLDVGDLDPINYQQAYHLWPRDRGAARPYNILTWLLRNNNKLLVGVMSDKGTSKTFAVRYHPEYQVLVGHVLTHKELLRTNDAHKIKKAMEAVPQPTPDELELGQTLLDNLPGEINLAEIHDTLGERQWQIVQQKAEQGAIKAEPIKKVESETPDLLAALRASVKAVEPVKQPTKRERSKRGVRS